jgi:hypothetical protein
LQGKEVKAAVPKTATVELAYTISTLEIEMGIRGIGASVMLFGVLMSTMYVQILVVGGLLTLIFTVLFNPAFWLFFWEK